jgi:prepilin-type N-terminal cleavage/methylation domain-containing protein
MFMRGFTLIELAVVLAIIAVLAAVLTPLVAGYIDEARATRALVEARTIAQAIGFHQADTGRYPIYATATATSTDTDILFGPGTAVTFTAGWGTPASTSLQTRLNTNFFSLPTTFGTGRIAYHGPYTVNLDSDPWGRTYVATLGNAPGNTGVAAFVISAGLDGIIQTTKQQNGSSFVVSGDDIVVRVK